MGVVQLPRLVAGQSVDVSVQNPEVYISRISDQKNISISDNLWSLDFCIKRFHMLCPKDMVCGFLLKCLNLRKDHKVVV